MKTPGNRSDYREFFYNFVPYRSAVTAVSWTVATLGPVRGRGPHRRCGRGQAEPDVRKQRSLQVRDQKL